MEKKRYEVFSKETQYKNGEVVNESQRSYGFTWAVSPAKAVSQICWRFGVKKHFTQSLGMGSYYTNTLIALESK